MVKVGWLGKNLNQHTKLKDFVDLFFFVGRVFFLVAGKVFFCPWGLFFVVFRDFLGEKASAKGRSFLA